MASKEEIQIILDAQLKNNQKTIDAVKKLEKNIKSADKSIKKAEKSTKFFSTTLGKLTGALGIGLLVNGFKNLGKSIVFARANMEQYEITFGTLLGSMEKGKELLSDLNRFSEVTPFNLEEINLATKQLLNANVAVKEIIPTLTGLGDIAAGLGQPIDRMAFLFARVKQNGKLMAQELNMFVDAGIPMIGALAEELGIAENQVRDFGAEGKISFEATRNALERLSKTKFANLMEKQNNSVLGQFSNLQVAIKNTMIALGKPFEKVIKGTTTSLGNFFNRLTKTIQENEDAIREWAENFVDGIVTTLKTLKNFGSYVYDFFSNTWAQVLAGALITWRVFATGVEMSAGAVIKSISAIMLTMGYLSQKVESEANKTVDGLSNLAKGFNKTAGQVKSFYDNIKNQISGGATGDIDLNELSKLTEKMNIPGGKHLEKKN